MTTVAGVPPFHSGGIHGRDRSAARTTVGGESPALALSIREVGASFHRGPRFRRPPCDPGQWAFPSPVLTLTPRRSPSHTARGFSADSHTPLRRLVCFHGRSIVRRPDMSGYSWSGQVPRVPLHAQGVTSSVMVSSTMSVGVTPRSSLIRTHAPVLTPPAASVISSAGGSMQVAVSPCGEEDLPDVVLHICPCVRGPLPRRLLRCSYPFLPPRHRPSPRSDRVGAPQSPCSDFSTAPLSRLQSFAHVQVRRFARHPDRSYRYGIHRMAAVTFPSEPLMGCSLPTPRICLPSESGN
jgi:hypothetical protein